MANAYWLIVHHFDVALIDNAIPFGCAKTLNLAHREKIEIGEHGGFPVYLVQANETDLATRTFVFLRTQIARNKAEAYLLQRAVTLQHFFSTHQFCGRCGAKMALAENELAMQCGECEHRNYPVLSPSIIVAVRRGKQILLANHLRHKGTIYTTLAGFVEAGEEIEQTVAREVFEESGLKIKNIRYFGSQPWAFPNSLMLGFLADYESGEIKLQEAEICDAQWFDYDKPLPELPPEGTIALRLIQHTLQLCAKEA